MGIKLVFSNLDNVVDFKIFLESLKQKHNLYYKVQDIGLVVFIDKNGDMTYNEVISILNKYQDIENLYP